MRALGIGSHREYLQYAVEHEADGELVRLLDAISTNFTSFFREKDHFELLGKLLEEWLAAGQQRLRIWSAASSSGEEPYSIAMVVREAMGRHPVDARILATDISTRVLEKARRGVYDEEQLAPVPAAMRDRWVQRLPGAGETRYEVSRALRELVLYQRLNLSTPPFPMRGPFDVVFCRNVMIYFDLAVRTRLLTEVFRLLKPGGYLFVGHAESLTGIPVGFAGVRPSVYVKPDDG
jgi:chemotaxis protein methyltransferase CheR